MNRQLWILIYILTSLATANVAHNCNRIRSSWNDADDADNTNNNGDNEASSHIDLSHLSVEQLEQLMKQLQHLQQQKIDSDRNEEELDNQLDIQLKEDDDRGSSRPWNKIQRIIKRQLIRIPKRYLKKFLRQFGLARSTAIGSSSTRTNQNLIWQPQLYYLIPLE